MISSYYNMTSVPSSRVNERFLSWVKTLKINDFAFVIRTFQTGKTFLGFFDTLYSGAKLTILIQLSYSLQGQCLINSQSNLVKKVENR